jgi:hypothetical protein
MAKTHSAFYTADEGGATEWLVIKSTAKTWTVRREDKAWGSRLVRSSEIGHAWHLTPLGALNAYADKIREELKWAEQRVHGRRTALGMVDSQIRRIKTMHAGMPDEPPSEDAVDPHVGSTPV